MLPVGADSASVCCYSLSRTKREGGGTFCLFPGAMANAMDMKTRDRTWHFFVTLRHHRVLVFVQTRTDVSVSGFGCVQRVLGARWTVEVNFFFFGVIAKAASARQYVHGELI